MSDARTSGREPLVIVEIDQDLCALSFGEAPCQAAIGVTGDQPCWNTRRTCQDPENYDRAVLTLRFCKPLERTGLPKSTVIVPSVVSVDTVPTEINIGAASRNASPLGRRAKVTITLDDHPYHDRLVDPYWRDRSYDPMERGTFWSKWLARNPYHQGRAVRIREGYVGQALEEMRVRHYVIERIEGPIGGRVRVIAKDPLKLLERAQAPRPSRGVLTNAIDEEASELILSPLGIGDEEYPEAGYARVGSEWMAYTRAGDTITLGTRGLFDTGPSSHEAGDAFQQILVFDQVRIDSVLQQLAVDFAGMPSEFVPFTQWQEEAGRWLSNFQLTRWISTPTLVDSLVSEILELAPCLLWWDEYEQLLQFRAMRPFYKVTDNVPVALNERSHFLAESVSIIEKPDERISRIAIYYDPVNPARSLTDPTNFRRLRIRADSASEGADQYGEQRLREVFAAWFSAANDSAAVAAAARAIARNRDTPIALGFALDAKDEAVRAGTVVEIEHRSLVDFTGAPDVRQFQVISVEDVRPGHRIEYKARPYEFTGRYAFIMRNDAPVYGLAQQADRDFGCYIAPDADGFADGSEPYRII